MSGDGSGSEWEKFGTIDPYFAVVNQEAYRGARLPAGAREQFFASGQEHVASVMADVRAHIDPAFAPRRGLDFGCGVGRLTIPLASVCGSVVGVDIAASMLAEARENGREFGITNMELRQSSVDLAELDDAFDLVHSFIVFQHIAPARGEVILKAILDHLLPGGVGVMQFTYHRKASRIRRLVHWGRKSLPLANNLVNVAQGRAFAYPLMPMHEYDLNRLLLMIQDAGCDRSFIRFTNHGGHLGVVLYFQLGVPSVG